MKSILALASLLFLTGCATQRPNATPGLPASSRRRPTATAELHAHPWPGVNKMIKQCHIRNFSIHEREINGQLYLFAYLEYTGTNFDADMKKMAADPETQRWWKETDPCQSPLPDAAAKGKIWSDTKEVYFLP